MSGKSAFSNCIDGQPADWHCTALAALALLYSHALLWYQTHRLAIDAGTILLKIPKDEHNAYASGVVNPHGSAIGVSNTMGTNKGKGKAHKSEPVLAPKNRTMLGIDSHIQGKHRAMALKMKVKMKGGESTTQRLAHLHNFTLGNAADMPNLHPFFTPTFCSARS